MFRCETLLIICCKFVAVLPVSGRFPYLPTVPPWTQFENFLFLHVSVKSRKFLKIRCGVCMCVCISTGVVSER